MNSSEQTRTLEVGDTVALNWRILHNRGCYYHDLLRARGVVIGLVPLPSTVHLRVSWDRPGLPTQFSPQELCRVAAEERVGA